MLLMRSGCSNCGCPIWEDSNFCVTCGHDLTAALSSPEQGTDWEQRVIYSTVCFYCQSLVPSRAAFCPDCGDPAAPWGAMFDAAFGDYRDPDGAPRELVFPVYIACDESEPMANNGGIDVINAALPELHATIAADPLANEQTRICAIAFAEDAEVLVPLAHAADLDRIPGVRASGPCNYGEAFRMLKALIEQDVAALLADGYRVRRPMVFFITGGEPRDSDWRERHSELTDRDSNQHYPIFCAFGVDGADVETIKQLGTYAAFIGEQGVTPAVALREIISRMWVT